MNLARWTTVHVLTLASPICLIICNSLYVEVGSATVKGCEFNVKIYILVPLFFIILQLIDKYYKPLRKQVDNVIIYLSTSQIHIRTADGQ